MFPSTCCIRVPTFYIQVSIFKNKKQELHPNATFADSMVNAYFV